MTNKRPTTPLRFKLDGREIVFRWDAVESVSLVPSAARKAQRRPYSPAVPRGKTWTVWVNGGMVFVGKEDQARKQFNKAMRYVA